MTILCGTDLSAEADRAVAAAAHVAIALLRPLRLVHVLDTHGAGEVLADRAESRVKEFFEREQRAALARLEAAAAPLRALIPVDCEVLAGKPEQVLLERAESTSSELVVVSAVGGGRGRIVRIGSTADRMAQRTRVPLLVVRDDAPFRAWAEKTPLRCLVGLDLSPTSDAALAWMLRIAAAAPCEVAGVHVYSPSEARARLKERGLSIGPADADLAAAIETELRARAATAAPGLPLALRLVRWMGRVDVHVAEVARDTDAGLLVVGTHQRQGLDRLWAGSVSREAIVDGERNVAVVPTAR